MAFLEVIFGNTFFRIAISSSTDVLLIACRRRVRRFGPLADSAFYAVFCEKTGECGS